MNNGDLSKQFKIALLTRDESGGSSGIYLKKSLENLGHEVTLVQYETDRGDPELHWEIDENHITRADEKIPLSDFDAVMPRALGKASVALGYAKLFEQAGVLVVNSTKAIEQSDSKVKTTQILQKANIAMPDSMAFVYDGLVPAELKASLEKFSNDNEGPIVIKPDYETGGNGIVFANSTEEALDAIEAIKNDAVNKQSGFVIQEFIPTGIPVQSHRVLVVGGEPLINWSLTAHNDTDLIANASRKTTVSNDEMASLAKEAAKVMGLGFCSGVDILVDNNTGEMTVLEVNDSPNLETTVDDQYGPIGAKVAEAFVAEILQHNM